ncbi:putative quinol monooxygenase [Catenovulum maritimum]|uniref:ABM domain-containing protein n=1 Tax=Catenovulum maritimum TaxID=1513271 RepID=A0A0J8GU74_9ALTE|nr:putative quinol monooxygenase [Catenovulum maritimum]KMT66292.1 hypothetical protein XM47_04690 [Catenovulum maritimum]
MYVVTVEFVIKPSHLVAFLDAILENAESSLKEEPDCVHFDVCQSHEQPTHFFLYELYNSEMAFQEHLESKHYLEFIQTVGDWVESKEVKVWQRC